MISPKDVITKNKLRDAKIINDWLSGTTQEQLALEHGITRMAIYHIIRKNKPVIKLDAEFAKVQRVHTLNHALLNSAPSKKDKLDIVEQLRKEYEQDKDNKVEVHNHFTLTSPIEKLKENRVEKLEL